MRVVSSAMTVKASIASKSRPALSGFRRVILFHILDIHPLPWVDSKTRRGNGRRVLTSPDCERSARRDPAKSPGLISADYFGQHRQQRRNNNYNSRPKTKLNAMSFRSDLGCTKHTVCQSICRNTSRLTETACRQPRP